jgi:hypothetical protein
MVYISPPRADSLRELSDNESAACKSEKKFKELRGCTDPN